MQYSVSELSLETEDCNSIVSGFPNKFSVRRWIPYENVPNALIVLDDELIGEAVIGSAKLLVASEEIAPVAIFSIGFDATHFGELYHKRAEFLTMNECDLSAIGIEKTGEGAQLWSFLAERIFPIIDQDFPRLDARPALAGYSLGGLFALQAAIKHPELVGNIAALSPSLFLGNNLDESMAAMMSRNITRKLFLAAGSLEEDRELTGSTWSMHELVFNLGSGLSAKFGTSVATHILQEETHSSLPIAAIPIMLKTMYGISSVRP